MSQRPQIQIRYNPVRTYPGTAQVTFPGAQTVAGRRGALPVFTDANSKFVAKTGSDANAGTSAAPYLTIGKALSTLVGAFLFAVVNDSGVYNEQVSVAYSNFPAGGLYSLDGQAPTIKLSRGVVLGTFGARISGRTKFSAGAPATFLYVAKTGNDGTGTRGNPALPFLTIQGALNAGARVANDTVEIQDSGIYVENLSANALDVTIQATAGQVPVLRAGAAGSHLTANAGVVVNLYGLSFIDTLVQSSIVTLTSTSEFYDCTFTGGLFQLTVSGGVKTYTIVGCLFTDCQNEAIVLNVGPANTSYIISNCVFENCTNSLPESVILVTSASTLSVWTISGCTFRNTGAGVSYIGVRGASPVGSAPTVNMTVTGCVFEDTRATPSTAAAFSVTIGVQGGWNVSNCLFQNLGGPVLHDTTTVANSATIVMQGSVALYCSKLTPTLGDIALANSFVAVGTRFVNCVFVGSKFSGISSPTSFGSVGVTSGMVNCAFLNCGSYGYRGLAGLPQMFSCLEANSGVNSATFATLNYCVFKTAGLNLNIGSGVRQLTDPLFLGTATGVENTAISASSPAINANLFGTQIVNIGPLNPTLRITQTNAQFVVDGLIFDGDKFFTDGILVDNGLQVSPATLLRNVVISHCTFTGLAGQAIASARADVVDCIGTSLNGHLVNMTEPGGRALRVVGQNCAGAAILVGSSTLTVRHCTAYGCEYGQFDTGLDPATQLADNVFCGNAVLDYQGSGVQDFSLICRISPTASLTNGTSLDPLFRDTSIPDLRIQTVETGFPFNSPAKLLASDGKDAGAYDFTYGALVETWTTVSFATGAGNSNLAYRNPEHVVRTVQPLKLSEGDTFGGVTFSTAPAFKTEHKLTWDPDVNMPTAQIADLVLIYTTGDGECGLSFDGGIVFIAVRILRSTALERTEIEGAFYSDDTLPTPVREMLFREST